MDVGGNIDRLKAAQQKYPAKYRCVFDIILDEVSRGQQEGKSSDTNALLWLKRYVVNDLKQIILIIAYLSALFTSCHDSCTCAGHSSLPEHFCNGFMTTEKSA